MPRGISYSEVEGGLAGKLSTLGVLAATDVIADHVDDPENWDMVAKYGDNTIPIETRIVSSKPKPGEANGILYVAIGVNDNNYPAGLVILISAGNQKYKLFRTKLYDEYIYIISRYSKAEIEALPRVQEVELIAA